MVAFVWRKADRFLKVVRSRTETPGSTDPAGCDREYSRTDCSICFTTAFRPTQGPAPRGPRLLHNLLSVSQRPRLAFITYISACAVPHGCDTAVNPVAALGAYMSEVTVRSSHLRGVDDNHGYDTDDLCRRVRMITHPSRLGRFASGGGSGLSSFHGNHKEGTPRGHQDRRSATG